MSRSEVDDLENAETYLNTALGLAIKLGRNYSPFQILDQRARLYFRKNCKLPGRFNVSEIRTAIDDLGNLLGDRHNEIIYLFRSVPLIRDFLDAKIDDCDDELRAGIRGLLEKMKAAGEGYTRLPRSQKGETPVLRKALSDAVLTLRFA